MHNPATDTYGSSRQHSVVQILMGNYEDLDKLERLLGVVLSNMAESCEFSVRPLAGLLDQLHTAGLVGTTDHFNSHCHACRDQEVIRYVRANLRGLMGELATQVIAASVPGAAETVDLAVVVARSTAAMDAFTAAPAAIPR